MHRCRLVVWGMGLVLGCTACSVEIHHGLDEHEANEMLVVLDRAGIPADKESEGGRKPTWKVQVPSSAATRAWQVLRQHELPRGKAKGFDLFAQGGLIPSRTEERARYQQALSGEIAKMLLAYPRVIDARVLVSVPVRRLGAKPSALRPKASVLVKYRQEKGRPFKAADIQGLVAGAVPGLEPGAVAVVASPTSKAMATPSTMARVGPFVVSRGSHRGLQIALIAGAAVILLLGGVIVFGALRIRRIRSRLRQLESGGSAQ